MSPPNLAPSGSTLCTLLLSLTLPLIQSLDLSSSGYFPTSAISEDVPKETTLPTYIEIVSSPDHHIEVTHAPIMDAIITVLPATTRVPTSVTEAANIAEPTSGAMILFSSASTHNRLIVETVLTETTTAAMPMLEAAATSSVSESAASEASPHATEGTLSLTTTTHGLDPTVDVLTKATTALPPTTNKSLTSAVLPSIGHSTKAGTADSPTTKPSSLALTNSPISPLVYGIPHRLSAQPTLTATTAIPYTSGLTLAPVLITDQVKPSLFWIITVIFLAGVVCVGGVLCICLLMKWRRQSQVKHFGSSIRSSHRPKGVEDDTWAGQVKLVGAGGWEECNGGEGGVKEEEGENERDEVDLVLSTFITNETEREGPNGGVGEVGSKKVKEWVEATLLYIDEDTEEETPKPANKTNTEGEKQGNEKELGEKEIGEWNGLTMMDEGTTFCLTTAV
ncbi:uncharacterized protein [Centroberyx affinis]|uniref:uncharacterized protein n=1 Tax=Centroberyx affinis TaxID=166261 RepID=UPI003A5C0A92